MTAPAPLEGGFADAGRTSARAFRAAMEAMARPGTVHEIEGARPPAPVSRAAGTLLLTLCDGDTPVHLAGPADTDALRRWLAFHAGAPIRAPEAAAFAYGRWEDLAPLLGRFAIGTPDYPDRSVTLIVERPALEDGIPCRLAGPGIENAAELALPEPEAFRANHARFPLGFDCFFTAGTRCAALPRSTEVL